MNILIIFTLLNLFENKQPCKIWLASHLNKKLYKTQILDTNIVETINTILQTFGNRINTRYEHSFR